jgi:hypothetical protein
MRDRCFTTTAPAALGCGLISNGARLSTLLAVEGCDSLTQGPVVQQQQQDRW